ncbi:MAG: major capsid protein [Bacteroidales bacterium]|nr:major capsid protein [Bacteroidales bacterium]
MMANVVNEKDFNYLISDYNVTEGVNVFSWFPLKQNTSLLWKSATNSKQGNQAAPVISRNASLPLGENPTVETLRGDIPKIGVKYFMLDDELSEFQTALRQADDATAQQLVRETLDNHSRRVIDMVNNRVKWMALQSMSRGKVEFTRENNGSVVAENDLDYLMQKNGRLDTYAWTDKANATPITGTIAKGIKQGKALGRKYKYVWMSDNTFSMLAATEEAIKLSASFATNFLGAAYIPGVDAVNNALRQRTDLNNIQIKIVDDLININGEDINPFIDGVVLFTETENLGTSFWMTPADMGVTGSPAMKALNSFICVKQWAEEDPLVEITAGVANIIPAFEASQRAMLVDVLNENWNEGV